MSKNRILIPLATILVALLAIAGVAFASSQSKPKIGLADAKPVRSRVLQRPAIGLHQAIDVQVKRIRAERRARARIRVLDIDDDHG